jgi:hypothetical protein
LINPYKQILIYGHQKMEHWTPETRNEFIKEAVNSTESHGQKGYYHYNVLPKVVGANENEDLRRAKATEAFAKSVFSGSNPMFRRIMICFYELLMYKFNSNPYTGPYMGNSLVVLIKGSNAYAYATGEKYPEDFKFSDMDIVVFINPTIRDEFFVSLEKTARVTVQQAISQFKRTLDHMFCLHKNIDDQFLPDEVIEAFANEFAANLASISTPTTEFLSPLSDDSVRNYCSRNSFMIANSKVSDDSVVRIEVPHYDRCERIPLRRTPFFASHNQTIDFMRDNSDSIGNFDLDRLRLNIKVIERDEEGDIIKEERIPVDFIDVSIASKKDSELLDFWKNGRCLYVLDKYVNSWLLIPDIHSCIADLDKMLNKYECPESKREKRNAKLQKLREILVHGI